jgi:hypothetical protein
METQPPDLDSILPVHQATNPTTEKLVRLVDLLIQGLSAYTGLQDLDRKTIAYWAIATHSLPSLNTFPLLVLRGKMGTGKSQTLMTLRNFVRQAIPISLRGMTAAAIRDKLAAAYEGTAIVEEADHAWKDGESEFERMLSDRYQRTSAIAVHKQLRKDKTWEPVEKKYFGATVLHRRVPFCDAAIDGRAVGIYFQPDHSRSYREYSDSDLWNSEGRELLNHLDVELPPVEPFTGVAARVFNTYRPLLAAAILCGDHDFVSRMCDRLLLETEELKEAQSSEPDELVLRAVVEVVLAADTPNCRNIKLSEVSDLIWRNHRVSLLPRQIGPLARQLGFITKASHGVTVVAPTIDDLLKACNQCRYSDDAIEELKKARNLNRESPEVRGGGDDGKTDF